MVLACVESEAAKSVGLRVYVTRILISQMRSVPGVSRCGHEAPRCLVGGVGVVLLYAADDLLASILHVYQINWGFTCRVKGWRSLMVMALASQVIDLFFFLRASARLAGRRQEHSGSLRAGHYTATAKNSEDKTWYSFNDSHVSPSSESFARRWFRLPLPPSPLPRRDTNACFCGTP